MVLPITELQQLWRTEYAIVPQQLQKIRQVEKAVCAFNTNIDAVVKITGEQLTAWIKEFDITDIQGENKIFSPQDVIRGAVKCFIHGIGEEWNCDDYQTFAWMQKNIAYRCLQMGGQAGIIANTLAVLGVKNVYAHTASHPKEQANVFYDMDNLFAVDEHGEICKAASVNRQNDIPLIHWIFEFDAGDSLYLNNQQHVCPKANRFIASYDPANSVLQIYHPFLQAIHSKGYDYLLLSGFHNLTASKKGIEHLCEAKKQIKQWKKENPLGIVHLELASTQDKAIRLEIVDKIAPLADSMGLNDCEAMDLLEIIDKNSFCKFKQQKITPFLLLQVLLKIKEKSRTPRIQLHFHGMYMTLQNRDFSISPQKNKQGMMLAATIAATKAGIGKIEKYDSLLWAHGKNVSEQSINLLNLLAMQLHSPELASTGVCQFNGYNLIAIPTILIAKPLTLVGMGDTISSISLLGAR